MRIDFSSGFNDEYTYWHKDVQRVVFKESGIKDDNDKFLLITIYTYDQDEGCTLDDKTLASWMQLPEKTIARKLKHLENQGHITIHSGTEYIPRIIRVGDQLSRLKYSVVD